MSVIKQISVFDGNSWNTGDIGADASNIDINSAILGSGTNVQSALTTIGNKIGTAAIPSGLGTTITGAINTLNTNLMTSEASTITPSISSGTIQGNTIVRSGKTINIHFYVQEASLSGAGMIGTLPQNYRPQGTRFILGYIVVNNQRIPINFTIATNGAINFSYSKTFTVTQLEISGTISA